MPAPIDWIIQIVFWSSLGLASYTYLFYPLAIWTLAQLWGKSRQPPTNDNLPWPAISLLIAAHNEELVLNGRLENARCMDYPSDLREIVVASDGSTDGTAAIVRRHAAAGVRLLDYPQRRGKAAVLNAAFPDLQGDIVILSDANTYIDPAATRRLVRWFRYPDVGVVCGRLVLADSATGRNVDNLYWRFETFLKRCEGRLGALLGTNGAIYAIRKELFTAIPADTIVDDLFIPLDAKVRTGCSIVYDYEAVAWEDIAPDIQAEFHRRSRIGAGGFQCIGRLWRLLNPARGWVAFTFLSHKVLRWLCPFFLLGMLVSSLLLLDRPLYQLLLGGQVCFYVLSLVGAYLPGNSKIWKPVRLLTMFTSMNAAILVGFWRWLWASQKGTWRRTKRQAGAPAPHWSPPPGANGTQRDDDHADQPSTLAT